MAAAPQRPALKAKFVKRRQAVVDEAARAFASRGFDATSIEDLSEATELTAGGLYHYIGSKDDLLFEIFNQLMGPLLVSAREIELSEGSALGRLRCLLRIWIRHIAAHRYHMLVFSQERHVVERDRSRWELVRSSRKQFERILEDLLGQASVEAGARHTDEKLMSLAVLGMFNYAPQWMSFEGRLKPEEIADGFLTILFAGSDLPGDWLDSIEMPAIPEQTSTDQTTPTR